MSKPVTPVILCGGAGSRLWPASRESYPKQLFAFGGKLSLFQDTLVRVTGDGFGRPIVVTGEAYRFLLAEQARSCGADCEILLEPLRRDSCAAIAAAAAHAMRQDPDAILLVLAADHAMPDLQSFLTHVDRAAPRRPWAASSPSASSRAIPRPAMAISIPVRRSTGWRECRPSTPSSRNLTAPRPNAI